ncbi:hypothetical protein FRC01_000632 [Tulasnella sp. 417]|nr:hypothetical protein FRC01_000632 [Tulasnella sp. 417]
MDREIVINGSNSTDQPNPPLRQLFFVPSEVWVEIFMRSLPPLSRAQAPQKTSIAIVCRFWNAIVESTPILWTRITIVDGMPYVLRSLSKSGDCPIDVNGVFEADAKVFYTGCTGICCRFIQEVQLHSRRWRHVALQVKRCRPSATVFPSLKSLRLCANPGLLVSDEYLALLDPSNTPHLRELSLYGTRLSRWDIPFSSTLLKLDIHNSGPSGPLSVELLSIISACPSLTLLRLRKIQPRPASEDDNVDDSRSIVELAALQELILESCSSRLITDLLQQLRLPEGCNVSLQRVTISGPSASTSFLDPVLASCRGGFQRGEKVDEMTVIFGSVGFHLAVFSQRWAINLEIQQVCAFRDALQWFGARVKNTDSLSGGKDGTAGIATTNDPPVFLKFSSCIDIPPIEIDSPSFTGIADLECINKIKAVRLPPEELLSLLSYLSQSEHPDYPTRIANCSSDPGAHEDTTRLWPFPGLSKLMVKGMREDVLKAVIEVVKSRWSGAVTGGELKGRARLKRIEFVDRCDEVIRSEEPLLASETKKAQRDLLLELLRGLGEDAKVFWGGKRVTKTALMD